MKLRTHKTSAKRIRITGSLKMQASTTSAQHLRHQKSRRILANAKRYVAVNSINVKRLKRLLPYLAK